MRRMRHATHHTIGSGVPTSENPKIQALRGIADPVERAASCQTFIANGRETLRSAQRLRGESIREARRRGGLTVDELAQQIRVRRNVVVDALRSRPVADR